MEYDYVGVDTETTGLNHQQDEVIEVTAVEFNLSGKIGKTISYLCRPMSGFIPAAASKVNGITYEMVKDKRTYLKDGVREDIAKFFGNRTVVGHNIKNFDIKFLKITPRRVEDTLEMCRARYKGSNKLKTACMRVGIKWDDKEAHRSEYDTLQCIKLYVKLKEIEADERKQNQEVPLFARDVDKEIQQAIKSMGVVPTESDKELMATQAYSFSRINLFHQCPFKWYMSYIKKIKQPDVDYLIVGKICHKAAEWCGEWVYRETFSIKLSCYAMVKKLELNTGLIPVISREFDVKEDDVTFHELGYYLYRHQDQINSYFPEFKGLAGLMHGMDKCISEDDYEKPSMPDRESFDKIVNKAVSFYKCTNPDIIIDVGYIMRRFYEVKDFSLIPGDVMLTEKKLAFDRDWNLLKDFYSNKAFIRGVIDVLAYLTNIVVITDYKSSRKMMTVDQLKEDMQMKTYVLLVSRLLPPESYNKIIVRIEYVRFGKSIEYEINDVKAVADSALQWINDSIKMIEEEMLKTDGAFEPKRNEYCHTCHLAEDSKCPLFNKQFMNNIDDPHQFLIKDIEDCQIAWKRVEANKAENSRLMKLCKSFVENCTNEIKIDENATLDFYTKEYRDFYSLATMKLLLTKGIKIDTIIKKFSITESKINELIEENKLELTNEELDSISKIKRKSTFEACTRKEAKGKRYINA